MNKSAIDWRRIESFIGFGRRDAPVVFIGMEEGLADQSDLENDLLRRSQFESIMDLKEAHCGIADTAKWFGPQKVVSQRTWRPMCDLMLRGSGVSVPTRKDRNHYQAHRLGRSDGDTLLCALLPYPHKKASAWEYARFGRYRARDDYAANLLPARKEHLRHVMAETDRKLIICYGKRAWPEYQQVFGGARWRERQPFRFADVGKVRVVLAPHFSRKEFNTDQQLAEFAEVALDDKDFQAAGSGKQSHGWHRRRSGSRTCDRQSRRAYSAS